jgi:nucleotidyltransferase substrate binding protein (TIGR01987 family)
MALNYSRRLDQLHRLNEELAEAPSKPVFTDGYVLSGLLSKFKICFDISWKLMKDILIGDLGIVDFPKGSPREVIAISAYNGLIADDEVWLEMLKLRNEFSHIYDGDAAVQAAHTVIDRYIGELASFEKDMQGRVGEKGIFQAPITHPNIHYRIP